ncbi:MAG: hypothetical protein ACQEQC_03885 [Elusimicrobiota bacterium]
MTDKNQNKTRKINFGTDGWRAVMGEEFTFRNVGKLSLKIAEYIKTRGNRVCIGYDNRFLSGRFAEFMGKILVKSGVEVDLSDSAVPTPAVSYRVHNTKNCLGVSVTASHNPPEYNGIKIKEKYGGSAREELLNAIVDGINKIDYDGPTVNLSGKVEKNNWTDEYQKMLTGLLPAGDLKVAVDYFHGTGYPYFREIIEKKGYRHIGINAGRDPLFGGIHPEPIPKFLDNLRDTVKSENADIGFAFDGDSDRIAVVNGNGEYMSAQRVLVVIAHDMLLQGKKGTIVKTVAGTGLLEKMAKKYKVQTEVVPIGFKNICPLMIEGGVLAAGEESGGIGFGDYLPERDGLYTAVRLLEIMNRRGKSFEQLWDEVRTEFRDSYYLRADVEIDHRLSKIEILESIEDKVKNTRWDYPLENIDKTDGIRINLEGGSWLLLRPSGTEPLIRIYAEAESRKKTEKLISKGEQIVV